MNSCHNSEFTLNVVNLLESCSLTLLCTGQLEPTFVADDAASTEAHVQGSPPDFHIKISCPSEGTFFVLCHSFVLNTTAEKMTIDEKEQIEPVEVLF
jgi:hypothetical protein